MTGVLTQHVLNFGSVLLYHSRRGRANEASDRSESSRCHERLWAGRLDCGLDFVRTRAGSHPNFFIFTRLSVSATPSVSSRRRWRLECVSDMSSLPPAPTTRCHGIPLPLGQAAMACPAALAAPLSRSAFASAP